MNNKQRGTAFEKEFCNILNNRGFWVHFCTPAANGSQPCDIIAAKDGIAWLIDCKTCEDKIFRLARLEDNQIFAFSKFGNCGNNRCFIAVKHENKVYLIPFKCLLVCGKVELTDEFLFEKQMHYISIYERNI